MADKQGKYIVVYKKGTPPDIIDQHAQDVEKQGKCLLGAPWQLD
jgi:hypothetical protein